MSVCGLTPRNAKNGITRHEMRICPMRLQYRSIGMLGGLSHGGWLHARTNMVRVEKGRACSGADGSSNRDNGGPINVNGHWKRKSDNYGSFDQNPNRKSIRQVHDYSLLPDTYTALVPVLPLVPSSGFLRILLRPQEKVCLEYTTS